MEHVSPAQRHALILGPDLATRWDDLHPTPIEVAVGLQLGFLLRRRYGA
jgi:hypothetical protein